jgi:hypothetical protein
MNGVRKAAAIAAVAVSIVAFSSALLGGGLVVALSGVLRLLSLGADTGLGSYPLGSWVFVVYVFGMALGVASMRWPLPAGLAMLPLGACAYFFGGPIAKVFGIVVVCIGVFLAAAVLHGRKA